METTDDMSAVEESLQGDLVSIEEWTRQWRMKVNVDKTEYCIFRKCIWDDTDITLRMKGNILKRVSKTQWRGEHS